ncbi:MAG: hypothetical protein KIT27_09990 [Legionellales bacterium]|nr:hypothetical protein [Legionellales bacterium]
MIDRTPLLPTSAPSSELSDTQQSDNAIKCSYTELMQIEHMRQEVYSYLTIRELFKMKSVSKFHNNDESILQLMLAPQHVADFLKNYFPLKLNMKKLLGVNFSVIQIKHQLASNATHQNDQEDENDDDIITEEPSTNSICIQIKRIDDNTLHFKINETDPYETLNLTPADLGYRQNKFPEDLHLNTDEGIISVKNFIILRLLEMGKIDLPESINTLEKFFQQIIRYGDTSDIMLRHDDEFEAQPCSLPIHNKINAKAGKKYCIVGYSAAGSLGFVGIFLIVLGLTSIAKDSKAKVSDLVTASIAALIGGIALIVAVYFLRKRNFKNYGYFIPADLTLRAIKKNQFFHYLCTELNRILIKAQKNGQAKIKQASESDEFDEKHHHAIDIDELTDDDAEHHSHNSLSTTAAASGGRNPAEHSREPITASSSSSASPGLKFGCN